MVAKILFMLLLTALNCSGNDRTQGSSSVEGWNSSRNSCTFGLLFCLYFRDGVLGGGTLCWQTQLKWFLFKHLLQVLSYAWNFSIPRLCFLPQYLQYLDSIISHPFCSYSADALVLHRGCIFLSAGCLLLRLLSNKLCISTISAPILVVGSCGVHCPRYHIRVCLSSFHFSGRQMNMYQPAYEARRLKDEGMREAREGIGVKPQVLALWYEICSVRR